MALASLTLATVPLRAAESGPWGAIASLRDDTNTHPTNKPNGGWYVAPIHAVLQARTGKVVVTGTKRIGQQSCNGTTQRNYGITFVLDPSELDDVSDGETLLVQPLDEQARDDDERHVLYCSGHIPLTDGRILYVAGTDYPRALPLSSPELGLDYARVFDPETQTFARVEKPMKGGPSESPGMKWYPTNRMLPDGRVLIAGGYHWSVSGPGDKENRSLEIFDPRIWDDNPAADPYTVLSQPADIPAALNTAGRAYTHLFLLPRPVPAASGGGVARTAALIGSVGDMWLFNHEPGLSGAKRMIRMPNAAMPRSGADKGEGSTSVMLPDGRIMVVNGGRDGASAARAYFYDPYADEWDSLDLGIARIFSTATWLPDGTVLLLNGYTNEPGSPWSLDNAPGGADGVRKPQIIDPYAMTVHDEAPWPETTPRGYHSVALLLKDGRVLIAGGKDNVHDTGCEKNEARIYSPPYLAAGDRPSITNVQEGQELVVGGAPLTIEYSGSVRAERGVALLAPGAMTHSYNQNQLYVPLRVVAGPENGTITVLPPATLNEAPPGEYLLHLVSEEGVPSVGLQVQVVAPPACVYTLDLEAGVFMEAEGSSRVAGAFRRVDEAGRGNDAFMQVDPEAPPATEEPTEADVLWFDVLMPGEGEAYVWVLGSGPSSSADTVFVSVDGGPDQLVTLTPDSWGWSRVENGFSLSRGAHMLKVKAAEPGARLDRLWITGNADAPAPDGLGGDPPETPCSRGTIVHPEAGGSGGLGGSGGSGMTSAGSAGVGSPSGGAAAVGGNATGAGSGNADGPAHAAGEDGGCGCRASSRSSSWPGATALLALLLLRRRRGAR